MFGRVKMSSVFVLISVAVTIGLTGTINVYPDATIFETAERCLRNMPVIEKQLMDIYGPHSKINVECTKGKVYKGD